MALISEIRKKSWLLIILIALGMGGFVVMDMVSKASKGSGSQYTVGSVNGQKIEWPDFQHAERILYPNSTGDVYGQRNYIWNFMVEERLLRDEAEDIGLNVGNEELEDLEFGTNHLSPIIQRNFRDPNTGQMDHKNLDQIKANLGTGKLQPQLEEYWNYQVTEIKKERIQRKLTNIVKKGMYTPTWLAQQLQAEQGTILDFKYVKIPLDTTATSDIKLTDEDFKNFMKENEGLMKKKEEFRTVDFVVFNVIPTVEDSATVRKTITDRVELFKEAKNDSSFVENNYGSIDIVYFKKADLPDAIADTVFKLPVGTVYGPYIDGVDMKAVKILDRKILPDSVQARHILIRAENATEIASARKTIDSLKILIESGKERFDSLAMRVSQDGSNSKGGDLGYSANGRMVKPFNDALFYTGKQGVLQVVTSQFGVHLIEITGRKFIKNTEGVKLAYLIEPIVPSEATQATVYDNAIEFSGQNRTVDALHKAVDAKPELSVETAEGLTTNAFQFSTLGNGGTSRDVVRWAFNPDTKLGSVSPEVFVYDEPTLFYNSHYVVPGLKTIMKKGNYTLAEVKEKFKQKVLDKKQAELIASKITNPDLQAVADQFHVPIDTFKNVNFNMSYLDGIGGETALIGKVSVMKVGETSKPIPGQSGTFVAQVINMAAPNNTSDLSSVRNQSLMVARGSVDTRLMEVLKEKATIKDNRYTFY
ncbi:MAG: peptidylprolyl isomerase [Saprospiraceae bacterium]